MKKIIIAASAALATVFVVGTQAATAMDFQTEMKMKSFVGGIAPAIYIAHACDIEDKFLLTEVVVEKAYEVFAQDMYDTMIIDLEFKQPELDYEFMKLMDTIRNNLEHPEIVKVCNKSREETKKILDMTMGKA